MKLIIPGLLLAFFPGLSFSQHTLNKIYPVSNGQKIELKFDYPQLIHVSSWNKKEIGITATVNINEGKNDDAFSLVEERTDGKLSIVNKIKMSAIPESYYIKENGQKIKFNSRSEMDAYRKKNPGAAAVYERNILVNLEVRLPANVDVDIISTYGTVELENLTGKIKIESTYGAIDAALIAKKISEITMTTRFGKIFTDLKLNPTQQIEKDFYTSITASPGSGASYDMSSPYGKIYLRKDKDSR